MEMENETPGPIHLAPSTVHIVAAVLVRIIAQCELNHQHRAMAHINHSPDHQAVCLKSLKIVRLNLFKLFSSENKNP